MYFVQFSMSQKRRKGAKFMPENEVFGQAVGGDENGGAGPSPRRRAGRDRLRRFLCCGCVWVRADGVGKPLRF